ncbi:hypothetical protein ACQ4PT_060966 [Festuca glaucescens]
MDCTPLKDLSRNSYRWNIMVRITRMSEFRSPDISTIYTLDFVVVDQQNFTMEGLVPGNRVDQFKDQLKEGCVYTIDKFDLSDPKKTYRSVDHPLRICFTMRTVLTEVLPPPENFPKFAYTALPFSRLSDRIDEKIVLSDVVGLVNKVTAVLPPSGNAKSHKRQVYITDDSEHAIVTLWGEQADLFDVDGLIDISNEEPVIVLFIGMTVSQYSGLLAFKSTSVTRWYVNAPIPEITAVQERYRFSVRAVDAASADAPSTAFADLYLFGPRGEAVIGKEARVLVESVRGEANVVPQDLLAIVGKEFSVVVTPRRESLDSVHIHLQVQIVQIVEPIAHLNDAPREGIPQVMTDQINKGPAIPELTGETSTPPPSMSPTPQDIPSSTSTIHEVELASPNRAPSLKLSTDDISFLLQVAPDSSRRPKHKNVGTIKNPKTKKGLHFSDDD